MGENQRQTVPPVLLGLARMWGGDVVRGQLDVPRKLGSGYCRGYIFNDHIRMLILHYELHEDVVVENPHSNAVGRTILFKFQHVFSEVQGVPSVLIATSSVNTDVVIPVHTNKAVINVEVDADYLRGLFTLPGGSLILQRLLENTQPLLFEQMVYPSLQHVLDEIVTAPVDENFTLFFLRVKAEELICKLLMELVKRDEKHLYAINTQDVQMIYQVKEHMLKHLDIPPVINDLALMANMSPTKLKRLFRQIFGDSIFHYYQEFRMKEAALLLKENRLSVSDVGGRLGFINLSHFAKVFKEHIGMNPRHYSRFVK